MSSNVNINQGSSFDPTLNPLYQKENIQEPVLSPIKRGDAQDVLEVANQSGVSQAVISQLHLAPVLPKQVETWTGPVSSFTIATKTGKPVSIQQPNRFNDMLGATSQLVNDGTLRSDGEIPYAELLKKIQSAINALQEELENQKMQGSEVDREFHQSNVLAYDFSDEQRQAKAIANNLANQPAAYQTAAQKAQANNKGQVDTSKTDSVQETINKLLGDSGIDPKIADQILLLGQLQYLQKNASNNASGGVIIGNNPEIYLALQKLGISLPEPDPNVPFAGMAAKLAAQNKPPYNTPEAKALAQSMPAGWEVISLPDLQALLQNVALEVRKTAGAAYGILAKPLQALFGSALFSLNEEIDQKKLSDVRLLVKYRDMLNDVKNKSSYERQEFIKKYQDDYQELVDKGLISSFMTPRSALQSGIMFSYGDARVEIALRGFTKKINSLGGEKILENRDPPADPNGLGRLASGAVVGNMTDSISDILNSLFANELTNSFNDSTLPARDKQNIQKMASITLITTVLGDALHSNPIINGRETHERLQNAIAALKDSGAAKSLLDSVFKAKDGSTLTNYQNDVLQEVTKAFMINIQAITATTTEYGVSGIKAYTALSSLKGSAVSEDVKAAQTFWETKADLLSDSTKFSQLAKQLAPDADSSNASIESQEQLREMIKLLKKILEQLTSGGESSQQLGKAVQKIKEGLGALNVAGFGQEIHG